MDMVKKDLERNIIAIGNSVGLTIPANLVKEMGLSTTSKVQIVPTDQGFMVTKLADADPKFVAAMNQAYDQYHDTLEMLRQGDE